MGASCARLLAVLVLFLLSLDAFAQRRGVRVDAGAWTDPIDLPSASCPGATASSPLVTFSGHVFSGRNHPDHLFDAYCQTTLPGAFSSDALFDPSEAVLAQMVGQNAGDRVTAIRYAYLDGIPFNDATGFQWAFYRFPSGGMIAALYGFDDPPLAFDHSSYIERNHVRPWDGGRDGYDGEFFCFEGERFVGSWDGTLDDAPACLLIGYRLFRGGFE